MTTATGAAPAVATTIDLPTQVREATVESFDSKSNTVSMVWTTGSRVRRYDWREGQYYDEQLVVEDGAVRLERLNGGAPFLNTHDSWDLSCVLGSIVPGSARVEGGKGFATVQLSRRQEVAGIVQDIKDGVIRNVSVGYRLHKIEKTEADDGSVPVWRVLDWEPLEISAVPIPADPGAQFRSEKPDARALSPCVVMTRAHEPTEAPRANPAEHEVNEMTVKTSADDQRGDKTADTPTPAPVVDADAIRAQAVEAERARTSEITSLAQRAGLAELGVRAVADGKTVEQFRTMLLDEMFKRDQERDDAGVRGAPHVGGSHQIGVGVSDVEKRAELIENAILHRSDADAVKLVAGAEEWRGMTLLEIAKDCLAFRGVKYRGLAPQQVADLALSQRSYETRSGGSMTTGDFPGILANVLNKTLRMGYEAAPQTFRPLVRVTSVNDFKPVQRTLLGEAPQFELVNEHGEFKRGNMGESKETYQIATFGKMVGITRQVIINDDLEAFTRIPRAFGVQAANLESDLVWAQILSNPTLIADGIALFDAAHNNLAAVNAAISVDSVGLLRTSMSKQTGLDGKTVLNISPSYLIVPKALQTKAEQFVGQIWATKTADQVPESLKNLSVISEPRLDNGITARPGIAAAAGSATAWYLAAAVAQIDIVELAYLAGAQGVYTETKMGFDVDGVQTKVRMDVGAKAIDFRGLAKNAGV